jgi:hypothetical protein
MIDVYFESELIKVYTNCGKKNLNKAIENHNYESFGKVITKNIYLGDITKCSYEIITGIKIPYIPSYDLSELGYIIGKEARLNRKLMSSYYFLIGSYASVTSEEVNKYIEANDNEEFKESLYEFIGKKYRKKSKYNYDLKINLLLYKIDKIAFNLPDDSHNSVISRKEKLLKKYNEDLKLEKPRFGLISSYKSNLAIKDNSVGSARKNLIIGLNELLTLINLDISNIQKLSKLKSYYEIINDKSVPEFVDNPTCEEEYIKSLIFIGEHINEKNKIKNKLLALLEIAKKQYENNMGIKSNVCLSLDNTLLLEEELKKLFNNYYPYYIKIRDYIETDNVLYPWYTAKEYINKSDIISTLSNIQYIIDCTVSESNYKKYVNMRRIFNLKIRDKYRKKIADIMKNDNIKDFSEFEIELRTDLIPILKKLKLIVDKETAKQSLIAEIKRATYSLKLNSYNNFDVVNLFISDIIGICDNNNIDYLLKQEIIEKINNVLNNALASIRDNKPLDEVKKLLYSELADIEISLKMFIISTKKYNEINYLTKKI